MTIPSEPEVDTWYQDVPSGNAFRVVALDRAGDSVEVQYFNGDLAEYDFGSWYESQFIPIEAPEDWSGPFDDVQLDDFGYSDPDLHEPHRQDLTLDDLLDQKED